VLHTGQATVEGEEAVAAAAVPPPDFGDVASDAPNSMGEPQLGQYPSSGTTFLWQVGHSIVCSFALLFANFGSLYPIYTQPATGSLRFGMRSVRYDNRFFLMLPDLKLDFGLLGGYTVYVDNICRPSAIYFPFEPGYPLALFCCPFQVCS
jgi:hypothetical protein